MLASIRTLITTLLLVAWAIIGVAAADDPTAPAKPPAVTEDLVKQANAPISSILQIRLQDSYSPAWQGVPGQGNAFVIAVTAPLREFRLLPFPQLSLLKIPAILSFPSESTGIGDVSFLDLAVFRFPGNDFGFGIGPTLAFPTANIDVLGQGKWQAGPAAGAVWTPGRWLIGVLAQNPISLFGDSNRPNVNELIVQPYLSVVLAKGWFVRSEPQMTINWNSGKQVLPINLGVGRVFPIGEQDVSMFVEPGWNISHDGPAPRYFINFGLVLLYPYFWERHGSLLSGLWQNH
jgi:hypothetical protein